MPHWDPSRKSGDKEPDAGCMQHNSKGTQDNLLHTQSLAARNKKYFEYHSKRTWPVSATSTNMKDLSPKILKDP